MDGSSGGGGVGHRRHVHRGSGHRTSFIEYVSEVYNSSRSNRDAGGNSSGNNNAQPANQGGNVAPSGEDPNFPMIF